jgi:hypothetical protein
MAERTFVTPKSRADWRRWLERHHKSSPSIWLVIFKKGSEKENLSVIDACEEALCFGWIDSLPGKIDRESTSFWYPRERPEVHGLGSIESGLPG